MSEEVTRFEAEAEATRERIAATVEDLQARLSPRALLNSAMSGAGEHSADAFAAVKRVVRDNPVGIASAGLAIGLALLGRAYVKRAKINYGDQFAAYPDYDDGYGANSVDARWHDDHPAPQPREAGLAHHAERSPLATILAAAAAGAVIGAVMPVSAFERDLFEGMANRSRHPRDIAG